MKVPERRAPAHLAVLAGCSAGAYALSLAGVTGLQSAADANVVRARAPLSQSLDAIGTGHDQLERAIEAVSTGYDRLATTYAGFGSTFADVERSLDELAGMTKSISKNASSLPSHVSLPAVRSAPHRAAPPPPATHATTGASG